MDTSLPQNPDLACIDAGSGCRAVLFVHGSCCDKSFFAPQVEYFANYCRVLAPDLRGHGASSRLSGDFTVPAFARDLAGFCRERGVNELALVGHSLGGSVALELARLMPGKVKAVCALDSALLTRPGPPLGLSHLLAGLNSDDYLKYFKRYFESAFEPCDDQKLRSEVLKRMSATPKEVMLALFSQKRGYDAEAALSVLQAPFLYIAAGRPRTDLAKLIRVKPDASLGQAVCCGHFLQLFAAGQINAMLEQFLRINSFI